MLLPYKYSVTVPSVDKNGNLIDQDAAVKVVLIKMSELFGGATATQSKGAWIDADGRLVVEDVVQITSYSDRTDAAIRADLEQFAYQLQQDLQQDAVAYETPNGLHLTEN